MKKILTVFLFFATLAFASSIIDTKDSDAITSSLKQRDDFYSRYLGNFQRDGFPTDDIIRSRLKESVKPQSIWFNYLYGESSQNPQERKHYFGKAINLAKQDIGDLWVLFLEFHKSNERSFETALLDTLQKVALVNGTEILESVADQLIMLADQEYQRQNFENAEFYLTNATRFTNRELDIHKTAISIPGSESTPLSYKKKVAENFQHSWQKQVNLVIAVYSVSFGIAIMITAILFIVLLFNLYSKAIHSLTCLYPTGVPYQMRFLFTTLLLLVLLVVGSYPVSIFLAILMNRLSLKRGMTIAVRALLVLLLLLPLGSIFQSRLTFLISDRSAITLYEQAKTELPTRELYAQIKRNLEDENAAPQIRALNYTSLAIIQFKRNTENSMANAVALIREAYKLWPENEPVLTAAANIYYHFGDTDQAFKLFKKAIDLFPESPEANYNYGQVNLEKVGITDGTDYINKGAELAPALVNGFIQTNSRFFGEADWPTTRRFFPGSISPETFWNNFMIFSAPPAGTLNSFWGITFFGLPLFISLGAVLAAIIISALIVPTYAQVKKSGECTLCGKPICKKCRVNEICNDCSSMLSNISNENLIESIKIKLSLAKRNIILWRGHICDIFVPGTRDLFLKSKSKKRLFTLIPLTIIVYSYYIVIAHYRFSLFPSVELKYTLLFMLPAIIFNISILIANVRGIISTSHKGGK